MDAVRTRVIEQRVHNRVIEYLELVGSYEQQIEYSWKVPIAYVPGRGDQPVGGLGSP